MTAGWRNTRRSQKRSQRRKSVSGGGVAAAGARGGGGGVGGLGGVTIARVEVRVAGVRVGLLEAPARVGGVGEDDVGVAEHAPLPEALPAAEERQRRWRLGGGDPR